MTIPVNYNQNLGNFILQRLLVLSNEELFEAVIKQMNALGLLKQAWINNKGGVLARFAERAGNLSEEKQLLVVATGEPFGLNGNVTVWRLDNFTKIREEEIGSTLDVRFNADGTKVIAVTNVGSVFEISLQ